MAVHSPSDWLDAHHAEIEDALTAATNVAVIAEPTNPIRFIGELLLQKGGGAAVAVEQIQHQTAREEATLQQSVFSTSHIAHATPMGDSIAAEAEQVSAAVELAMATAFEAKKVPGKRLLSAVLERTIRFATSTLLLSAEEINKALGEEMLTVHVEADISKLDPALQDFSVLADDEAIKAATSRAADGQHKLLGNPDSSEALSAIREQGETLKAAYDDVSANGNRARKPPA